MLQLLATLALASAALFSTPTQSIPNGEFFNPPPPDPECVSGWYPLWSFDDHPLCDDYEPNGHCEYYLCETRFWSEWNHEFMPTSKLVHTCAYISSVSIPPPVEEKLLLMPMVIK